jgi:hypothetical protein
LAADGFSFFLSLSFSLCSLLSPSPHKVA